MPSDPVAKNFCAIRYTSSTVTRSMAAGTLVRADQAQLEAAPPPIGGTAASALAVPLVFGGEPFAVLYADSPATMGEAQVAAIDLLGRNAVLILSRLGPRGYEERGRVSLLEPTYPFGGRKVAWAPPAYANRHVFARSDEKLVCASLASKE